MLMNESASVMGKICDEGRKCCRQRYKNDNSLPCKTAYEYTKITNFLKK